MSDLEDARQAYLELRDGTRSVQLATLTPASLPEASYAPCVWYRNDCYLFLSALSSHSANLLHNSAIGLLLLEQPGGANPFARQRASLHGDARPVGRDQPLFAEVMQEFHRCFGKVMQMLEPLPDFRLFRVELHGGSFVRGFGQAYRLSGDDLDRLDPVDPRPGS